MTQDEANARHVFHLRFLCGGTFDSVTAALLQPPFDQRRNDPRY